MVRFAQHRQTPQRAFAHWVALLALLVQALVVQPHIDRAPLARSAEVAGAIFKGGDARIELVRLQDAPCVICQAGAVGTATLVTPPALGALSAFALLADSVLPRTLAHGAPGHIWRSRAPPRPFR